MVNIIVVFPKQQDANSIRSILQKSGYDNVFACSSGAKAISMFDELDDGIVISGYKMVDMMYSDIKDCMPSGFEMLLMASERTLSSGRDAHLVCLSMPMKVHNLIDTVGMMEEGILRKRKKRREMPRERSDEQKKLISDAKKLLIERNHMTEEEAHHYIQKCSMDSGTNMVETAQMVLSIWKD